MRTLTLPRAVLILLFLFLLFAGLYYAKPFLVPFTIAAILAMLFLPISRWLERKGLQRGWSSLLCVLLFVSIVIGIVLLLSYQISSLAQDASKMKQQLTELLDKVKQTATQKFGISPEQQKKILQSQQSSGSSGGGMAISFMSIVTGFLVDTILTLVYMFLFLFSRRQLTQFVLRITPNAKRDKTRTIIENSTGIAQKYLGGLSMMIVMLWILYGIGFSIVGVKNAIFFAILCGLLEIVPFVGNVTGTTLTLLMSLAQGGSSTMIIGILVTYGLVQFVQTYILEPLVVGSEVNINPLFTIVVLVIGELVWGIPGMILAIPLLGIAKVVCDNVEPLQPYGYLIGEEKKNKNHNLSNKIKGWFKK